MTDKQRHRAEYHKPRFYPVISATVIECGDLLWWDSSSNSVKPASDYTYGSDLASTQKSFRDVFVGMAADRSRSGDTEDIQVDCAGVVEFACASATFNIGDLIGVDDNSGGTALEDQQVIAVSDPALALGKVEKRYSSATTSVRWELFPKATQNPVEEQDSLLKSFKHTVTSAEDTAGQVDLDTGWGETIAGSFHIELYSSSLVKYNDLDCDVDLLTGSDLGKIRIKDGSTRVLAAGDILMVTVRKYTD